MKIYSFGNGDYIIRGSNLRKQYPNSGLTAKEVTWIPALKLFMYKIFILMNNEYYYICTEFVTSHLNNNIIK